MKNFDVPNNNSIKTTLISCVFRKIKKIIMIKKQIFFLSHLKINFLLNILKRLIIFKVE